VEQAGKPVVDRIETHQKKSLFVEQAGKPVNDRLEAHPTITLLQTI
jgi:hypothetical protein